MAKQPLSSFYTKPKTSVAEKPSLADKIWSDISSRGAGVVQTATEGATKYLEATNPLTAASEFTKGVARTAGDIAGTVLSPVTTSLGAGLEAVGEALPEPTKLLKTGINLAGESLATVLDKIPGYSQMVLENPQIEQDIERALNLLALKGAGTIKPGEILAKGKTLVEKGKGIVETGIEQGKGLVEKGQELITPVKTSQKALGEIAQGESTDVKPVKTTLEDLSIKGKLKDVETFDALQKTIKDEIPELARQVDAELGKDTKLYKPEELQVSGKTEGGKIIKTDHVTKALNDLAELYKTTGDAVAEGNIKELMTKAKETGLTRKEVNDISRTYGQEFSKKAFSKATGEPLTSVNAQAFENTRTGLKDTAREGPGGPEAKALDAKLSDYYDTQKLIQKNIEAVNKLQQKIQERGLVEKVGYTVAKYADLLSGGSIRGFVGGLLPRGAGYKVMNALDIEAALNKNLQIIEKALKQPTEQGLIDTLEGLSETTKVKPNTQGGFMKIPDIRGLIEEAKKYKSAEEFVKAQGTPVYHGTSLENANKINTEGFKAGGGKGVSGQSSNDFVYATGNKVSANKYVSDRLGIKKPTVVEGGFNGKTLEINGKMADFEAFGEASKKLGVPLESGSQGKPTMLNMPAIKKAMQEQGYGAISFSDRYANGSKAYAILPENIKTKSQLTDIWNKANAGSKVDPLIAEAKKFKSAEEFVKAQAKDFHGTNVRFDRFDKSKLGVSTKAKSAERGFWFTDNKDVARGYSEYASEKRVRDILNQIPIEERKGNWSKAEELTRQAEELSAEYADPIIIESKLNLTNPAIYDAKGAGFLATDKKINDLIDKAIKDGNDALIVKNLRDSVYSSDIPVTHTIVFDEGKVLTKSQLTDIWNTANKGSKIDPLVAEARKYKSAEEFVKSKISPVSGRVRTAEIEKVFKFLPDGTTAEKGLVVKQGDKMFPVGEKGITAAKNSNISINPDGSIKESFGLTKASFLDDIDVESQLTDIWNKANN